MSVIQIEVPDGYLLTANVNDKAYQAPPEKMTNGALLHALEYGFQRIVNDKTGGKNKTPADKDKIASGMIARLTADEYKRRAVGVGVDPLTRYIRSVLRSFLKVDAFKARAEEYKAYSEPADRDAFLDDWFDTMPDELAGKVENAAEARMAEDKARDSSIAALAADIGSVLTDDAEAAAESEEKPAKKPAKKSKSK